MILIDIAFSKLYRVDELFSENFILERALFGVESAKSEGQNYAQIRIPEISKKIRKTMLTAT